MISARMADGFAYHLPWLHLSAHLLPHHDFPFLMENSVQFSTREGISREIIAIPDKVAPVLLAN